MTKPILRPGGYDVTIRLRPRDREAIAALKAAHRDPAEVEKKVREWVNVIKLKKVVELKPYTVVGRA